MDLLQSPTTAVLSRRVSIIDFNHSITNFVTFFVKKRLKTPNCFCCSLEFVISFSQKISILTFAHLFIVIIVKIVTILEDFHFLRL